MKKAFYLFLFSVLCISGNLFIHINAFSIEKQSNLYNIKYTDTRILNNLSQNSILFNQNYGYYSLKSSCPVTWQTIIKATDAGNKTDSLKYGVSPDATDLTDTCLGEYIIPPAPPAGIYDLRFILSNNDAVKNDFRNDTNLSNIWKMNFQPSASGYPFTFTWDSSGFPADGSFFLKDTTGVFVNINMRNQNSYVLSNSAINNLYIVYSNNITRNIEVLSGWNIISVPLSASNMSVSNIFPGAASPAYAYNNGYVVSDSLRNSKGYWIKFNSPGVYSFPGQIVSTQNIGVSILWNLIGPFDEDIPVSDIISVPSGLLSSFFFGFDDGYIIADTLRSGKGYWVRSNGSGILKKGTTDNIIIEHRETFDELITFDFSDNAGIKSRLYLSKGSNEYLSSDLPPVPPAGIFDIRYSTDRFIGSVNQSNNVKINSPSGQIKLIVTNTDGHKLRITDNLNGRILDKEITEGEEIFINPTLDNFNLINESLIPDTYELSQNYPNPFNPSTKIKYHIPAEGNVKIIVYDISGKEVFILVNKFQTAGKYETDFNSANISSGVYFYKIESGNFSDLKSMILLK